MDIGIIGVGFVGNSTMEVLKKHHKIFPYDKYKTKYSDPTILKKTKAIFICVPTPAKQSGEIDLSSIKDSLTLLQKLTKDKKEKPLVIIRSTVIPGTTDKLAKKYPFDFIFNPEFLREKHAIEDMINTDRIVIGANNKKFYKRLREIYDPIFPNVKYIEVDLKTAEMIKYSANSMLAGQIALANEIYQISKSFGIEYQKIKEAILLDDRIARNISVPGNDGDLGFGGKCFPKDLGALIYASKQEGYTPRLFEEILNLNNRIRTNKDWLKIPGATSENIDFKD